MIAFIAFTITLVLAWIATLVAMYKIQKKIQKRIEDGWKK